MERDATHHVAPETIGTDAVRKQGQPDVNKRRKDAIARGVDMTGKQVSHEVSLELVKSISKHLRGPHLTEDQYTAEFTKVNTQLYIVLKDTNLVTHRRLDKEIADAVDDHGVTKLSRSAAARLQVIRNALGRVLRAEAEPRHAILDRFEAIFSEVAERTAAVPDVTDITSAIAAMEITPEPDEQGPSDPEVSSSQDS
jgi:hypothetical protein